MVVGDEGIQVTPVRIVTSGCAERFGECSGSGSDDVSVTLIGFRVAWE
jgi:hypothetical protein